MKKEFVVGSVMMVEALAMTVETQQQAGIDQIGKAVTQPISVRVFGVVVKSEDDHVVLAREESSAGLYSGMVSIPHRSIISWERYGVIQR